MATRTKAKACAGKVAHATRAAALAHIGWLAKVKGASFGRYGAYRCGHCAAWHVGHRMHRKRKEW